MVCCCSPTASLCITIRCYNGINCNAADNVLGHDLTNNNAVWTNDARYHCKHTANAGADTRPNANADISGNNKCKCKCNMSATLNALQCNAMQCNAIPVQIENASATRLPMQVQISIENNGCMVTMPLLQSAIVTHIAIAHNPAWK